jgi:hypothetical protein
LFTCGEAQIHTIEAVIASAIIFGAIFFAVSIPSSQKGLSEFQILQLKKYADDILDLLSAENANCETTLKIWIKEGISFGWDRVNQKFYNNISLPLLRNLSIATRLEIYRVDNERLILLNCNGTLSCDATLDNCASSFRIVAYNNTTANRYELYEVRVIVCYV